MADPKTSITDHVQEQSYSCAAWGIEVALKIFDKRLPNPTIQAATPDCGFGEAICNRLRDEYGLQQTQKAYGEDFGSLEREVLPKLLSGAAVLVILPSGFSLDAAGQSVLNYHTYAAYQVNGELFFGTRIGVGGASAAEHLTAREFDQRRFIRTAEVIAAGRPTASLLHTMTVEPFRTSPPPSSP
jgi:hypothetical protein